MPDTNLDSRPGLGHNQPPDALALVRAGLSDPAEAGLLTKALFDLLLDHAVADDAARAHARGKALAVAAKWDAERPEIQDADQADKATNLAQRLSALLSSEEKARVVSKGPWWDGGKAIDAAFAIRKGALEKALGKDVGSVSTGMLRRIGRWNRRVSAAKAAAAHKAAAEAERLLEEARKIEAAQREVAEAAARGAPVDIAQAAADDAQATTLREQAGAVAATAATLAEPVKIRTDHGAQTIERINYDVFVHDPDKIPREYLIPDLEKIKISLKAGLQIPGCSLRSVSQTTVR